MPTRIAIAVVEFEGRYLIGQRPEGVPLAGLWEFPGGKLEAGESPEAAARRECLEEAGIDVIVEDECFTTEHDYAHGRVELHFFQCRPRDPSRPPRPPYRWIARADLARYTFPAANDKLLRKLQSAD